MRLGPSLLRSVGAFVVTTVTFAAAMVIAHSLSIPDPAGRFLPGTERELPEGGASMPPASELDLAREATAPAHAPDEPVTEVTAVPVPPSPDDTVVADGPTAAETAGPDGVAVSSSRDSVATARPTEPAPTAPERPAGNNLTEPGSANDTQPRNWTWPQPLLPRSGTPHGKPPPSERASEPAPEPSATTEPPAPEPSATTEPPAPEPSEPSEPSASEADVQSDPIESEPASSEVPTEPSSG